MAINKTDRDIHIIDATQSSATDESIMADSSALPSSLVFGKDFVAVNGQRIALSTEARVKEVESGAIKKYPIIYISPVGEENDPVYVEQTAWTAEMIQEAAQQIEQGKTLPIHIGIDGVADVCYVPTEIDVNSTDNIIYGTICFCGRHDEYDENTDETLYSGFVQQIVFNMFVNEDNVVVAEAWDLDMMLLATKDDLTKTQAAVEEVKQALPIVYPEIEFSKTQGGEVTMPAEWTNNNGKLFYAMLNDVYNKKNIDLLFYVKSGNAKEQFVPVWLVGDTAAGNLYATIIEQQSDTRRRYSIEIVASTNGIICRTTSAEAYKLSDFATGIDTIANNIDNLAARRTPVYATMPFGAVPYQLYVNPRYLRITCTDKEAGAVIPDILHTQARYFDISTGSLIVEGLFFREREDGKLVFVRDIIGHVYYDAETDTLAKDIRFEEDRYYNLQPLKDGRYHFYLRLKENKIYYLDSNRHLHFYNNAAVSLTEPPKTTFEPDEEISLVEENTKYRVVNSNVRPIEVQWYTRATRRVGNRHRRFKMWAKKSYIHCVNGRKLVTPTQNIKDNLQYCYIRVRHRTTNGRVKVSDWRYFIITQHGTSEPRIRE